MKGPPTEPAVARAQWLAEQLHLHNHHYHVLDDPLCTDAEYDALFAELKQMEDSDPSLLRADSPIRRVGSPPVGGFQRHSHLLPMLSIANAFDAEEVAAFEKQICRHLSLQPSDPQVAYCAEPKIDGLAVSLQYRHGQLHRGMTRGDGTSGEDITANLRVIPSIPLLLRPDPPPPALLEVRLEVFMPRSGFEALNTRLRNEGKKLFVNPRNAAASGVRQLDPAVTQQRPLDYFCYGLGVSEGWQPPDSHLKTLRQLGQWGLKISPLNHLCRSTDELAQRYKKILKLRDGLDYDTDGMVCKLDSIALRHRMGQREREPRWAVAWKFPPQERTTRLLGMRFQVGRTGAVTPVGELQPVEVGGVQVRNVSLHNFDELRRLDLRIGDEVVVRRAGDVIPQVVQVRADLRPDPPPARIRRPKVCPCPLSLPLVRGEDQVIWRCGGGHRCPLRRHQALVHFVSRRAVDIRGLSGKLLQQMLDAELVSQAADLYELHADREALLALPRQAEKSVDKLLAGIEQSRRVQLNKLIFALGIEGVGEVASGLLAQKFHALDALAEADVATLESVSGIGAEMAGALTGWFADERNKQAVARLKTCMQIELPSASGPLAGYAFLFTGTLSRHSRQEAKDQLQRLGAEMRSAISATVDCVIAGEKPGGKLTKAQQMGIRVLNEEEFSRLLKDPESISTVIQEGKAHEDDDNP